MMDEALGAEPGEQALCYALFQMKVDCVFGKHPCIPKYDWSNRCLAAPLGNLLILLSGCTESIEGRCSTRVSLCPTVQRWKSPDLIAVLVLGLNERTRAKQFK